MDHFRLLDIASPHEAYQRIRIRSETVNDSDIVLLALAGIDDVLRTRWGPNALYILDDRSVGLVLAREGVTSLSEIDLRSIHFELSVVQLVFRFTSAMKFRVPDSSVKQLRINSWGRSLCECETRLLATPWRARFRSVVEDFIESRRADYEGLIYHLRRPVTPEVADRITELNGALDLKIVA